MNKIRLLFLGLIVLIGLENTARGQCATLQAQIATFTNVSCPGGTDGSITASATGGLPSYFYLWSNSATSNTITGLAAGTYTVTVTDSNNCTATITQVISEPSHILITIISAPETCPGSNDGAFGTTVTGGTPPYSYLWSNGSTTASNNPSLAPGGYMLTVTDANGCTDTISGNIMPASGISIIDSIVHVSPCFATNGAINITPSGGSAPYTYTWSNGATTQNIAGLAVGTYTVTVNDVPGCSTTDTYTVTDTCSNPLNATTNVTNVTCNGLADGSVDLSVSGGNAPYSFLWSTGATTEDISGVPAGTYTVTVTDNSSNTTTISVNVSEPAVLIATAVAMSPVSCGGNTGSAQAMVAGGTPPYTFLWSNGQTSSVITGLTVGSYIVTITDANGCSDSASVNIGSASPIIANPTSTNAGCGLANGTASVSPTGGTPPYFYNWSNGSTSATATGLSAGGYSIVVTDTFGCSSLDSIFISQQSSIVINLVIGHETCPGDNDGAFGTGVTGGTSPYAYAWSNGATVPNNNNLAPGVYTLTVTDANGCTATTSATIQAATGISIASNITTIIPCGGTNGAIDITPSGGSQPYTYNWSNGATTQDLSGLAVGTYTVTVNDVPGCSTIGTFTVTDTCSNFLNATTISTDVTCNGLTNGSVNLSVSGGTLPYTFLWSSGATTEDISGVPAGTYTVTITDNSSNTTTSTVTILEPTILIATAVAMSPVSCGNNTGSAQLMVTGGTPPYTFLWSNGQTTSVITGLAVGSYIVTITDANGCSDSASVSIGSVAPIMANLTFTNVTCNGQADGTASVSPTGGTPTYFYNWSNGATSASVTGLAVGGYSIIITDSFGCSSLDSVFITQQTSIVATVTPNGSTFLCPGGSVQLQANSGSGFTYQWQVFGSNISGATGMSYTATAAGNYTVVISSNQGCAASSSAPLSVTQSSLSASFTGLNPIYCLNDASSTLVPSTGGGQFFGAGVSGTSFNPFAAGIGVHDVWYSVSDSLGCSDSTVQVTEVLDNPQVDSISGPTLAQPSVNYTYTAFSNLATNYAWTINGGTIVSASGNSATVSWDANIGAGSITVVVSDSFGCSSSDDSLFVQVLSTGVNNLSDGLKLNVFPNPATETITIGWDNALAGPVEIQIVSTSGQVVFNDNGSVGSPSEHRQVNVANWSKGFYLLRLVTNEQVIQRKLIVQ